MMATGSGSLGLSAGAASSSTNAVAVSRKHVELSLELKRKLIQEHEHGVPFTLLGKKYHIATSTAANIWRKKDFFLRSRMSGSRKRCNDRSKYKIVNQVTALFVKSMLERNHKIDGEVIKRFARTAAAQCNFKDFHGSNGWLDSFKKRENVCWVRRRGERASSAAVMAAASLSDSSNGFGVTSLRQSRSDSPNISAAAAAAAVAATAAHNHHHHSQANNQDCSLQPEVGSSRPQSPQMACASWVNTSPSSLAQQADECDSMGAGCCNRCNVAAAAAALAALNSSDSIQERDHEIDDWFSGIPFLCQFFEEYQSMQQAEQSAAASHQQASKAPNVPVGSSSSGTSTTSIVSMASNCSAPSQASCNSGNSLAGCRQADNQQALFSTSGPDSARLMSNSNSMCSSTMMPTTTCDEQVCSHQPQGDLCRMNEHQQLGSMACLRLEESVQNMDIMMKVEPSDSLQHQQQSCCQSLNCGRAQSEQDCAGSQAGSGECNATMVTSGYNSDDQEFYIPSAGYLTSQDGHSDELMYHSEVPDHNGYCSDHYDRVSGCDELQLQDYQTDLVGAVSSATSGCMRGEPGSQSGSISFVDQYEYKNISTIRHYPVPMPAPQTSSNGNNSTNNSPPANNNNQASQQHQFGSANNANELGICSNQMQQQQQQHQQQQQQQQQQTTCRLKGAGNDDQSRGFISGNLASSGDNNDRCNSPPRSNNPNASSQSAPSGRLIATNQEQIYQQQTSNSSTEDNLGTTTSHYSALMQDYEQSIEHADDEEHHLLHNALMRSPEKLKLIDSIITLLNYASNYNQKMLSPLLEIKRCIERDLEVVLTDTSNQVAGRQ